MSAVENLLTDLKAQGRAALIGYLPIGYPSVDESIIAARSLIEAGVDIIELGMPYTDPVLDGPVIQAAVEHALAGGVRLKDLFRVISALQDTGAPILVMTYFNPVFHYGIENFARDLAAAGGAGLITPDLTPDSAQEWIDAADKYGLDKVFLVAPSSTDARLKLTGQASRGFIYAASTMGVTGTRTDLGSDAELLVQRTRDQGGELVCVGLGVSTADQAAQVGRYADGVIVGSAFVKPLSAAGQFEDRVLAMQEVARSLAHGIATSR